MDWVACGIVLSVMVRQEKLELRGNIQIDFWIKDLSSDSLNQSIFPGIDSDSYVLIIYFN